MSDSIEKKWRHVNREHFPMVYLGPTNKHIEHGTPVKKIDRKVNRMGLRAYTAANGEAYLLIPAHVVPYEKPPSRIERAKRKVRR